MTIEEYNHLTRSEQYNVTVNKGTFIEAHTIGQQRHLLYAVDTFFVEITFKSMDEDNDRVSNTAFVSGKLLDKYTVDLLK